MGQESPGHIGAERAKVINERYVCLSWAREEGVWSVEVECGSLQRDHVWVPVCMFVGRRQKRVCLPACLTAASYGYGRDRTGLPVLSKSLGRRWRQ